MEFLTNPNTAYISVVAAIMLLIATISFPKSVMLKVEMVLCLGIAFFELFHLKSNHWALLMTTLSPLPFFVAIRQTRMRLSLLTVTILLLTVGAFFLFVDQNGRPATNHLLAGLVSVFCGEFIWIAVRRELDVSGGGSNHNPDSLVGVVGEARTEIHEGGSVRAEGDLWPARSEKLIPAGSLVRILRQDGIVLTVKKVEKLTK